jgi:hypothetical protein
LPRSAVLHGSSWFAEVAGAQKARAVLAVARARRGEGYSDNLASLLAQEPDAAKWVSSLVVRRVTERVQAEVVGNRSSTRIANEFDRSVGQIDVAQFASQGRRARIVKHKELGGRSSLDLVTYVLRELRIAKLNQLKGKGPLSGNDTSNIGFRRRSILHCRRVDRQSRALIS